MTYNNIYRIIFARLAVMLLPTMLRKPVISAYLRAAFSQFDYIGFAAYRRQTNYRLTHNGQVCYLRAVLNDMFDTQLRRIEIGDGTETTMPIIYWREQKRFVGAPPRGTAGLIVGWRGTTTGGSYDFTVRVPAEIFSDSATMTKMTAVVREYKLASKQFQIIPL